MAFLARVKPGILKKPGFLNLDAGEGIGFRNPVFPKNRVSGFFQKTGFLGFSKKPGF